MHLFVNSNGDIGDCTATFPCDWWSVRPATGEIDPRRTLCSHPLVQWRQLTLNCPYKLAAKTLGFIINCTTSRWLVGWCLTALSAQKGYIYYYYYYYYKCHGLQCCHHSCGGTLQNLDLKLLHSSMQTSADHWSRRKPYDWRKRWDLVSLRNVKS